MKKVIFLIALGIWVSVSHAECSGVACIDVKIQDMEIHTYDTIVWVQTTGTETSLSCTPQSSVFIKLDTSTDGGKNVFASLLSIQAQDAVTDIRIHDNVDPCTIAYVRSK